MNKSRINFLNSVEEDLNFFKISPKYLKSETGADNLIWFLGYLKDELENKLKGLTEEEKEKLIKEVLEREYAKYKDMLKSNLDTIKKKWSEIEADFFNECEKIFDGNPFPEGEYTAIQTLWGRYICVIEKKKFGFPANTKIMMLVVMHELLHFAFYDYYAKNKNDALTEEDVWQLSEILNTIILNREPFLTWAGEKSDIYPALQEKYEKLDKIYDSCKSLKEFIEKSISTLKG